MNTGKYIVVTDTKKIEAVKEFRKSPLLNQFYSSYIEYFNPGLLNWILVEDIILKEINLDMAIVRLPRLQRMNPDGSRQPNKKTDWDNYTFHKAVQCYDLDQMEQYKQQVESQGFNTKYHNDNTVLEIWTEQPMEG